MDVVGWTHVVVGIRSVHCILSSTIAIMIVWYLAMMRRSHMSSSLDSSCESMSSDVVNLKPKVTQTQVSYGQEKSPQIVI